MLRPANVLGTRPSIHLAYGLPRPIRGVSKCEEHARASPCGKQRRQAAALHMRCAFAKLGANGGILPSICAGSGVPCPYETRDNCWRTAKHFRRVRRGGPLRNQRRSDAPRTRTNSRTDSAVQAMGSYHETTFPFSKLRVFFSESFSAFFTPSNMVRPAPSARGAVTI